MASGDTKTEALLNILGNGGDASEYKSCCNTKTQNYILDAIDRVQNVEDDIEELKNNPDVVDIVDTYADLEAYDTSTLTDKDIIRVLQDSNYNNNSTYYRWDASTNQFDFVGEIIGGGGGGASITTLTSADANWPENNPTDIALWLLEPGIYKKGDNTNIWFCKDSSQSSANSSVIGNWTSYQTMFIVGLPVLWNGSPITGQTTLMAFAGATAGDGLSGTYPCIEWAVYSTGVNQGNASTTIRYVKENELKAQSGTTAPTASTNPRYLGDLYVDTANQDCYVNVRVATGANVWKKITP